MKVELWAFLENSDFQRRRGKGLYRQDEVALIGHDRRLEEDYRLLKAAGFVGVRDAARWYRSHPASGRFDWTWLDRVVPAAGAAGLTLYLDLWHYGYPDWLDLLAGDAPKHFAEFAGEIAVRYRGLELFCVSNEPSLMVERAGARGEWRPFLRRRNPAEFRRQLARMIVAASETILSVRPSATLALPEPWHAPDLYSEDDQAAILDIVLGRREPEVGGHDALVTVVGLNHYRDSTLPPLHRLLLNARRRWPDKPLWLTETSGPPRGWKQEEWFWWMLAELRLANSEGADVGVFTWAPAISMYDWVDETKALPNGVWLVAPDGTRSPNGHMLEAISLARELGYLI